MLFDHKFYKYGQLEKPKVPIVDNKYKRIVYSLILGILGMFASFTIFYNYQ